MFTLIQSLIIAFSAHFVGLISLYAYLLATANTQYANFAISQGVYHVASIYTSISGMTMAGFFQNMGKRATFFAVMFLIALHFVSGFILSYVNEEALYAMIQTQVSAIYRYLQG